MKSKVFYIAIFLSLLTFQGFACDICGCGAGTGYLGVLPQFNRNLAGFRFQYSNFLHPQTELNYNGQSRVLEDHFYTTEAWLRYYPAERWQLFVHVPYTMNRRTESRRTTTIQGIGDVRLNFNYTLLDYGDSITTDWKNLLLIGGGVSLPTGKYQQRDETRLMLPAAFQVGAGAFSYNVNVVHTLRYRTWGFNTNLRYTFRGENELTYDYGNQFTGAAALFYWGETKSLAYLPSLGVTLEHFEQDYQYGEVKPYTGGAVMNATAGVDIYIDRFLVNTFVQVPFVRDVPSAQPSGRFQTGMGVSVFFGRKKSNGNNNP